MKTHWLLAAAITVGSGCMHNHDYERGEEGSEVKMNFSDAPAPVREGMMREARGATIKTVDKQDWKGKTVYETDVMMNGQTWEIRVDENGNLISKKIEDEKEEKEEKGEHR